MHCHFFAECGIDIFKTTLFGFGEEEEYAEPFEGCWDDEYQEELPLQGLESVIAQLG
jgi:hypothetical protein